MTETTDIKALIDDVCLAAAGIHNLGRSVSDERAQGVIDFIRSKLESAFEAERQRAYDEAALNKHLDLSIRKSEGVNAKLRERAEKAEAEMHVERNAAINLSNHLSDCAGKLRAANIEIAALKGERVPVAVFEPNGNLTVAEIRGDIPRRKAVRELYEGALVLGQELFTAPQKPVVLPGKITRGFVELAEMYGCEPAQAQFIAVGWNAAIEAAGGIVKDGE